jgi:carboxyl-terminal processing protease
MTRGKLEVGVIGRIFAAFAGLCLLVAVESSAQAEPRVALVIGNSNYGEGIGKLPNPANDAALMTTALQQTGFTVIKVIDADQKRMKRAIVEFGEKLANAGPTATGLFYYAGHGIQVKGLNYLIPVDAHIEKEADVSIESLTADDVMEQMEFAANAVNIIIMDACRNNPVSRSMRSATRGLAPMQSESVRGTFIAYSTAPGQTAADGTGTNSPYSQALAKSIVRPGVGIEEIFRDVRGQVMQATEEKQIPWDSSSLTAPFFFQPGSAKPASAPTGPNPAAEKAVWEAVKDSKQASDYQAYLDQYPQGTYAGLARSRLTTLGGTAAPAAAAKPAPAGAKSAAEKAAWDSISTSKQPGDFQAYLAQYPQGTYAPLARSRLAELNRAPPAAQPQQPAAAPAAATAPETQPATVSEETTFSTQGAGGTLGGLLGPGPKIEYDSHGVDCRIMDSNRSDSECRNTKKPKKANKPRG